MNIVEQFLISKATEKDYFQTSFGGEILNISNKSCQLNESSEIGCVYGIAIKIESPQIKNSVFSHYAIKPKSPANLNEWHQINDTSYYPLYWGSDNHAGSRIKAHISESDSTFALHLIEQQFDVLSRYTVIYGGILCAKRLTFEKWLHEYYPDLLQGYTHKSSNI